MTDVLKDYAPNKEPRFSAIEVLRRYLQLNSVLDDLDVVILTIDLLEKKA